MIITSNLHKGFRRFSSTFETPKKFSPDVLSGGELKEFLSGKEAVNWVMQKKTLQISIVKTCFLGQRVIASSINKPRAHLTDITKYTLMQKESSRVVDLSGKNGICLGMCRWFLKIYLQTKPAYSHSGDHIKSITSIFTNGGTREATLLQFIPNSEYNSLFNLALNDIPTLSLSNYFDKKTSETHSKLNKGIYLVLTDNHATLFIKHTNYLSYFFDPNIGSYELRGYNQDSRLKTLLSIYKHKQGIRFHQALIKESIQYTLINNDRIFSIYSHAHFSSTIYLSCLDKEHIVCSATLKYDSLFLDFVKNQIPELQNIKFHTADRNTSFLVLLITEFENLCIKIGNQTLGVKLHTWLSEVDTKNVFLSAGYKIISTEYDNLYLTKQLKPLSTK